ncbi:hypothetical protein C0J52_02678 [Blattella germanica]|nr:hypothetical protein C0J52_02678 [Blattella germanica]
MNDFPCFNFISVLDMSISWCIVTFLFLIALQGEASGRRNGPTIVFVSSKHTGTDRPSIKKLKKNVFQYTPAQQVPSFRFIPPKFPNLWNTFPGYNEVILNNRIMEIEHRLRIINERLEVLDNFLHCANITVPPQCSEIHPIPVVPINESRPTVISNNTHIINTVYTVTSQSTSRSTDGSEGAVVTSTYNKQQAKKGMVQSQLKTLLTNLIFDIRLCCHNEIQSDAQKLRNIKHIFHLW